MALNEQSKNHAKAKEVTDLGLSSSVTDKNQRVINKNGSFNIEKKGIPFFKSFSIYHYLISISWMRFCLLILTGYIIVNLFFALLYYLGGEANFEGIQVSTDLDRFINEFFFSTQTFTTVGYGRVNPVGIYANVVSSVESLAGLLSLAIATGVLYGRFSRPVAKILYSTNAIIAPFQGKKAFQFRIANQRTDHTMVDVEVEIMFSMIENNHRKFYELEPEYDKINFFASTWTVNHPINENSPLYNMTENALRNCDAEFLILVKGFDDTFAQVVHSRTSYTDEEVIWGAKFSNIYRKSDDGKMTVQLDRISEFEKTGLP